MTPNQKIGTARDRYFVEQAETLCAVGAEMADAGARLIGIARHLHAVALGTATHGDLSVAEARRLGAEMLAAWTAHRATQRERRRREAA